MCTYISVRTWIQIIYFWISIGSTYCIYVDPRYYDTCIRVIVTMCYIDFAVDVLGWSRMKIDMWIHHGFVCVLIGAVSMYHKRKIHTGLPGRIPLHILPELPSVGGLSAPNRVIVQEEYALPPLDSDARHVLITAMLSTEISTMFLMMMPLFQAGSKYAIVRGLSILNQVLFVVSFTYYRLYHYTVYLLWNGAVHAYIYNEIFYVDQMTYETPSPEGKSLRHLTPWLLPFRKRFHQVFQPMSIVVYCAVESAIFGMWILNLYWFVYIVRKSLRRRVA